MSYLNKKCSNLLKKYSQQAIDLTVDNLAKQADQLQRTTQQLASQLASNDSSALTGHLTPEDTQTLNKLDADVSNLIKTITTTYPQYRENVKLNNIFNVANQTYSLITSLIRTFIKR